ncbi:internalin [Listeria ivanovii]|uniref:MucBP domain-containing protein n=1 Tax=Listeria ivanovii TaxID=1638 RepID=UPI000DA966C3|nr:MucBP domain-containing protein [Listeria ivanovii]PZG35877.1 internalin [Listeria ivanovii]PZG49231.1 internalin [Listeria ivanovii]PZH13834.1 internalin [Listeria ivanovii]
MKTPKIFLVSIISSIMVLNPMMTMAATNEMDAQLQPDVTLSTSNEESETKAESTESTTETPLEEGEEKADVKTEKAQLKTGQSQSFNDWFPDDKLALKVAAAFGMQPTENISEDELATLSKLDCSRSQITDMTGIEYLIGLTNLDCSVNSLTVLDVSENTKLVSLDCASNQLINIDLSQNTQLTLLDCHLNKLTILDVTTLINLVELSCSNNTLAALNLSQNTNLQKLDCSSNKQIANLDVTALPHLTDLNCSYNKLPKLDVTQNTQLVNLDCSSNSITKITGCESLPDLVTIDCDNNKITELDVTSSTLLTNLSCSRNKITGLDVTPLTQLTHLFCDTNLLSALDVTQNTELTSFTCSGNSLGELNVTQNTKLVYLTCINNDLVELDLSMLSELKSLECRINDIAELDVTYNNKLTTLICDSNPLTVLDVSQNTELTSLYCQSTNVSELDLSNNPKLSSLSVNNSQFVHLDLSNNPKLSNVSCLNNHIQDFSTMNKVTRLDGTKQTVVMPKQTLVDNQITINVNPNLLDQYGVPMNITPGNGGVYNQATNTITWQNRTEEEGVVAYDFASSNGNITGKVTIPYEAPAPEKAEDVTVRYLSDDDEEIAIDDILSGNIGDDYTTSPKTITGYTLKTIPGNATGKFTADAQSVRYVYTKDIEVGQPISVNYIDTAGKTIADSETLNGNVGETYNSTAKNLAGYTLTTIPTNANGIFTNDAQTVTYIYTAIPVGAQPVTVNYLDYAGNKIADSELLTGNIGESYTLMPKTIEGYTLTTSPANAIGLFTADAQTVNYLYTKNNITEYSTVKVCYVDEANNPISESTELIGTLGDSYTASPKYITGYSLITKPKNESGTFMKDTQTVTFIYKKTSKSVQLIPKVPDDPTQTTPKNTSVASMKVNITSLPRTGDKAPWQPIFVGLIISASVWTIWRKRN